MSRWALFKPVKVRAVDGQLLIKRIRVVQTPVFELLIHRLQTADSDVDLHTHPWELFSFVLRGGYTERFRPDATVPYHLTLHWDRWSHHRMRRTAAHRITDVLPGTVTLAFVWGRRRPWGFCTDDGWVTADEYGRT